VVTVRLEDGRQVLVRERVEAERLRPVWADPNGRQRGSC